MPDDPTLALGNHESKLLPLAALLEPPNPSRSQFDEEKLEELAASMRARGVLQHLIVVEERGQYEIIAGHRRYHAAKRAGLAVVPCDVYPRRADADEAVQHAENRYREDLSPSDEAIWFSELVDRKFGGDVDQLAAYLGEKRAYVESRLLLFQGDPKVFQAIADGQITLGVATQLNRCDDEQHRRMLLYQAIQGGATIAVVSGWIAEYLQLHKPANKNQPAAATPAPAGPALESKFFTCVLCGKDDNVHLMQPANMHTYCRAASFGDMLELWKRRHEYHAWPRTVDEAVALVNDVTDRFPELLRDTA
jgi:ParB family chromosome partitioning protein